jgi:DNA (cytosine-5)-methyltransferase 1
MSRPRLLDLFCKAGGAGMGYSRAGFEVVGVDKEPQQRYPFCFVQADALEYAAACGHCFDAIHASPPCQADSIMRRGRWKGREHPQLIPQTRELLISSGKPYVIENVVGADLIDPIMLCGSMFGLRTKHGSQLRRHRLFELNWELGCLLPLCAHNRYSPIGVYGGRTAPAEEARPCDYRRLGTRFSSSEHLIGVMRWE